MEKDDVPVTNSEKAPVTLEPVHRLVDTLIENYRKECTLDFDEQELKQDFPVDNSADTSRSDVKFTDVIRVKSNFKGKKPEPDKFVFSRAVDKYKDISSFIDFKLSKPLLKSLTEMNIEKPTPVQCACIPVALMDNDICACARTGSGKTLAFLIPILERLTKKHAGRSVTQALVISPTRELAVQIFNVAEKLVKYCPKLRVQLAAGGLDLHSQEASLRSNPDIVIATPGRLIDHLSNSPCFNLQHIDYLVLDEADKLLDEYFTEQIGEIIRSCSKRHQTLLFSATMTESVKELAILSLRDPVQIFLSQVTDVAQRLEQEFIRIREHREEDRCAIVAALLLRSFRRRTIVFLPTKVECHRMHILFGLLGLSCAELHGNMTQSQRLEALRRFSEVGDEEKDKKDLDLKDSSANLPPVDILLATDLASRGLDIPDVQTVINYTLPKTMKQYVHRVGRTARIMNVGRAVSLAGEDDRKLLKLIIKDAPYPVKSRVVPAEVILRYHEKIKRLEPVVKKILEAEKEEREIRMTQSQLNKVEDLLTNKLNDKNTNLTCVERRIDWFKERKRSNKAQCRSTTKKTKKRRRNTED